MQSTVTIVEMDTSDISNEESIPVQKTMLYVKDEKIIEKVQNIRRNYNTLDKIKELIKLAEAKGKDFSELYVSQEDYIIALNLLIIEKIIYNNIKLNDEVIAILKRLDPAKEYKFSSSYEMETETLLSWAYTKYSHCDRIHHVSGIEVLKFLLDPQKEVDCNPMVHIDEENSMPLMFIAIEKAASGDRELWDLYKEYIDTFKAQSFAQEVPYEDYKKNLREKLKLDTVVHTNEGKMNTSQFIAYKCHGKAEILAEIAKTLECTDNVIEQLNQRKNGVLPNKATSSHNNIIPAIAGVAAASIPVILHYTGVLNNLSFPAGNIITCLSAGLTSAALVFVGFMIYNAAISKEQDWKKAGLNAVGSFLASISVVGAQELAHHFLPKLPEVTIAIYAVGAAAIAALHAFVIPEVADRVAGY